MSSRWKTGIAALLAAGTVFGASAVSDVAKALPPGTPQQSAVALTPGSGTFATPFNFTFSPPNQACPGDNTQGWFFSPYLTADDPAALTFSAAGSPVSAGTGRTVALRDTGGNLQRNIFPNLVDGLIVSFPDLSLAQTFATTTPLAPGDYNVGIACYNANAVNGLAVRENARYWNTEIRVTESAGVFSWTTDLSEAPSAPVIGAVNTTLTSATVNFTQAPATPAVTGYTATVTPTNPAGPALAPIAVAPGATSFVVTGLTTGAEYSVSMIATNSVGDSPASNVETFIVTENLPAITPFTFAAGAGGSGEATLSWTIPAAAPTGYTLTVAPAPAAPAPDTYTIAAGASSQVVTGLEAGTVYTFTLQPDYAPPVTGDASTVQGTVNVESTIQQRITVTRPVGQLILTQRCGVNGDLPAFTGVDTVPGFPTDLPAIAATDDQTGTSPDIDLATPGVQDDPEFDNYPFPAPATYPTECGLNLGTSTIVTTGDGAGLYFKADGRIDEVTVTDTRDSDAGWTLSGTMTDFVGINTPANTIDGNWMGWIPQLQSNTVNQTITTGPAVAPGTGVADNSGLGGGSVLGSAAADAGLGITEFDARLLLLIPTDTPTDTYVGLLNLSVV